MHSPRQLGVTGREASGWRGQPANPRAERECTQTDQAHPRLGSLPYALGALPHEENIPMQAERHSHLFPQGASGSLIKNQSVLLHEGKGREKIEIWKQNFLHIVQKTQDARVHKARH